METQNFTLHCVSIKVAMHQVIASCLPVPIGGGWWRSGGQAEGRLGAREEPISPVGPRVGLEGVAHGSLGPSGDPEAQEGGW